MAPKGFMMTSPTSPILLSPEQHEFVKANLAALLASEYSIINQSSGKLEYLSAKLMGFSNHQQRNAMLKGATTDALYIDAKNDSHLAADTMSELNKIATSQITGSTETWPAGWLRNLNGCMSDSDRVTLASRGWCCWQKEIAYEDHEFESTYKEINGERHSFNAVLTIAHDSKSAYISLGDNFGDGVNTYVEFRITDSSYLDAKNHYQLILQTLEQQKDKNSACSMFCQNFLHHPDAAADMISELIVIAAWFAEPTTANLPLTLRGCTERVTLGQLR